ncbi:MAG: copper chaperone PCu(A)C [Alphaproteobacteria bacterium]|nr:copper chaperone PCu(A)C [Alphaproteobacteria bacterium]MBU1606712.1 copper chaperone PCu(A)C [Alphaproteobacteria bacterium]
MKHKWKIIALAVAAAIAAVLLFMPPLVPDGDTEAPPAPEFGSQVRIDEARLVLPTRAGAPARVYFDITNVGEGHIYISEVAVEHGDNATMTSFEGDDPQGLSTVSIERGETVVFGPESERRILTDYDSNIVPGTEIRMRLTFGNAETVTVPMRVYAPEALVDSGA